MFHRVSQRLVVTAAIMGALALSAAPNASALAGGSCSVAVPTTVSIAKPYTLITAKLGADCAANSIDWAAWDVRHSYYGPSDFFFFDQTSVESIGFWDWDHFGTYYVEPDVAYDIDSNTLTQNTRSFVVKADSRLGVTATRAGSYVTLNATASYYNGYSDVFKPWNKDKVVLQYRTAGTSTWRYLSTRTTTSNGKASYRVYAPKARYYRAGSTATTTIWGQSSAAVYR
jgi:hypothetical protein